MSLTVPTAQEYRATLERLANEHARRVVAEREAHRLRDQLRKRSEAKPRDWSWEMYEAAEILASLPPERSVDVGQRRDALRRV